MSDAEWWYTHSIELLQHPRDDEPFAVQIEVIYGLTAPSISRLLIEYLTTRAVVQVISRQPLRTNVVFYDALWNRTTFWAVRLYEDTHLAPNRGG